MPCMALRVYIFQKVLKAVAAFTLPSIHSSTVRVTTRPPDLRPPSGPSRPAWNSGATSALTRPSRYCRTCCHLRPVMLYCAAAAAAGPSTKAVTAASLLDLIPCSADACDLSTDTKLTQLLFE